ncbi:hypothetical protein SCLCIDRAFT_23308 [Scleroderma citrinum Foug A]|uniref:DUF6830 domain-containing protein n=1 Tax=Scleroderma citrinum Foug A TaxID=1036808 RepID=A0A0C3E855_9AGAM|nr:hypothetical protein SCLCIDRAFT_23308 [Scleroderma citrinum Foug A]
MSGNRMAHPLLLSLANIDTDIHSKSSLHSFLLLALFPVPSFIHNKSRVWGLLSDRLIHQCLNFVLKPLKIAAAVGVMMSDPIGNLHHCYTPLVTYIADTPEQNLVVCMSPKASPVSTTIYKEFGDGICHPPRTVAGTLHAIKVMCAKSPPTDLINFLKAAKEHRLNGVFKPFWRDWFHSDPSRFLLLEVLHHLHRFSFDHDLQWCISVVGSEELDYCFSLTRTLIGLWVVTTMPSNATSLALSLALFLPDFLLQFMASWISAMAQMPSFDENVLTQLSAALQSFHDNKEAIISAGVHSHFEILKLELLQHVVPSIQASGAMLQWSADVTEHAHVTEIKKPAHARNNQNYYSQIAHHLDRAEKCTHFDLATRILLCEDVGDACEEDEEHEHEHNEETDVASFYPSPTCKVIHYFDIVSSLSNGDFPDSPKPFRTFASSTTTINLALKPSFRMSIGDASELFQIPDLHAAICTASSSRAAKLQLLKETSDPLSSRVIQRMKSLDPKAPCTSSCGVRRQSIQRKVGSGSGTEVVEGTFISTAGKDEEDTAAWLNGLATSFSSIALTGPIQSLVDCNRPRTRGYIQWLSSAALLTDIAPKHL